MARPHDRHSELLENYSLESVPLDRRKSWINLAVIWIGIAVVMSAIFRGMMIGLVSDADGAISALASAAKIVEMRTKGDQLKGDVIVTTHLCSNSPVIPHEPVPFMGSPISIETMNAHEIDNRMEAILSIDTTKGNRVINQKGFAISPTVFTMTMNIKRSLVCMVRWNI
jgi:hypothetical protein